MFTDTVFNCISGQPTGNALAINPLLLGFTEQDWTNLYQDANPSNGQSFTGTIIDTCNPVNGGSFADPNTGKIIGGRCDYPNVLDLFGQPGLDFLNGISNGDDFFDGTNGGLTWTLN